jgi:hypothetical protein
MPIVALRLSTQQVNDVVDIGAIGIEYIRKEDYILSTDTYRYGDSRW